LESLYQKLTDKGKAAVLLGNMTLKTADFCLARGDLESMLGMQTLLVGQKVGW